MGLSDEERIEKAIFTISHMVEIAAALPEDHKLKKLCDQLWHALLSSNKNSAHWIFGSSTDRSIEYQDRDPWSTAVRLHILTAAPKEKEDRFSLKEDYFSDFTDIPHLLGREYDGRTLSAIFEIYQGTEGLIYAVRRYDDDLRARLHLLDKLISDIQGECFNHFKEYEAFAKAYLAHRLISVVMSPRGTKDDLIISWARDENLHHYVTKVMCKSLQEIGLLHRETVKALKDNQLAPKLRLTTLLKLMGSSFHYEHMHKKLLDLLKKNNWPKKDIAEIKKLCEDCKNEKEKEDDSQKLKTVQESELAVYEFTAWEDNS